MSKTAIECKGITKRFGPVIANNAINLTVRYGEIMALLGENGSGKTTLMNILSGIYHPDQGTISIGGQDVVISSPTDAFAYGIGMIHQHFKLVEVMSAFENILIGPHRHPKRRTKQLRAEVEALCERYELPVDLDKKIYDMSVSEKQTVEVLKVLFGKADILILDEPTAVLTPQEVQRLFAILRHMKEDGRAIVIITHKLNEVMEISDRVAILRKGQCVDTAETSGVDEKKLTEMMVGRPVSLAIKRTETDPSLVRPILTVENLTVPKSDGTRGLEDVSFTLCSGEILGVAGVAGSGQKELCEAIVGLARAETGQILYEGQNLCGKDTREIYRMGVSLAFVPEDRLGMGLCGSMGMVGNMLLKTYAEQQGLCINRRPAREMALGLVEKLDIKTPGVDTPVRLLSGGNVQKVLLGREIDCQPKVLLTAFPVRGLDINASYTIYDLLGAQKERGCGVLYVGEDLDVLLELCDRILVLCHGRITGIVSARAVTKEQLGLMMAGLGGEGA